MTAVAPGDAADWALPEGNDAMKMLEEVDKCIVEQQLDMMEVHSHIDQPNKYKVYNEDEKQMFFLEERDEGYRRTDRAFDVVAKDAYGNKVFNVSRDYKMCAYCFFCCACCDGCKSEAKVKVGGKKAGKLEQDWSVRDVKFSLYDDGDDDDKLFLVQGKIECCTMKAEYDIKTKDGEEVGYIKRLGEGLGKGMNKYKIKFPENTKVKHKALIIGTCILFDYRFHYYVDPTAHQRNRRRRRY